MAGPPPPQKLCPSCGTAVPEDANICLKCGYNFNTGPYSQPPSARPNPPPAGYAGQSPNPNWQAGYPRSEYDRQDTGTADGLAIASLVLGIISMALFCIWCVSVPFAVIAFVLGLFGLKGRNRNLAIAGMICGGLATLISIGFIVLAVSSGFGGASGGSSPFR